MEQLETLKRKTKSAEELHSLVRTMKAIAAANIREYENAVESLAEYNRTIEMGFHILMRNMQKEIPAVKPSKRLGAVVFGSERGMCGRFNEQVAYYAIKRMNELKIRQEDRIILALGERVLAPLEEAGEQAKESISIFGTFADIASVMHEVLIKVEEWHMEQELDQIVVFYNRPVSGASFRPRMQHLLPLDLEWLQGLAKKRWPSRTLPSFTMDRDRLLSSLVRQYLFISLYRAFVESLASENTSRLLSMQVAEKNIEERLNELRTEFHRLRQDAITAELLDIVAGFEALTGGKL